MKKEFLNNVKGGVLMSKVQHLLSDVRYTTQSYSSYGSLFSMVLTLCDI